MDNILKQIRYKMFRTFILSLAALGPSDFGAGDGDGVDDGADAGDDDGDGAGAGDDGGSGAGVGPSGDLLLLDYLD
ncbi:unnamed protein product [Rhizophagus irregularis]|nr:unnamed protein product [Rhizophagus irregularis]